MTWTLTPEQQAVIDEIKARPSVEAHVWIAPGRYSGEPCVSGHRIPTRMVADGILAGVRTGEDFADDYGLTRDDIMVACWFEARHGRSRRIRKAWAAWLEEYDGVLWSSDPDKWAGVPFPPAAPKS